MKQQRIGVVLAGGAGTRLWPRSRVSYPKHLLKLTGDTSPLQQTVERLRPLVDALYVVTEQSHAAAVRKQLPHLRRNIIIEPTKRGTASAIALAIWKINAPGLYIFAHADHSIGELPKFRRTVQGAFAAARESGSVALFGLVPRYPSSAFGYIQYGKRRGRHARAVKRFVEKPSRAVAAKMLKAGTYLWNVGMFVADGRIFKREFKVHMPKLYNTMERLASSSPKEQQRLYRSLPTETIDYGVMERSKNIIVIPADFSWSDIGSWSDLYELMRHDENGNVFQGSFVDIESKNCLIVSPKQLVATVGLENIVVIATDDAILICPKDRSQDVKKIVDKLKRQRRTRYL